ncbi:Zinc-finger homeodomain protein 2 [Vitis vinifera]|uniref:Zinc-finger homeodomain protein 2 n=1 Tax=Vitis vinifera TaxID=29760 RepID=A0A438E0Z8_VITVI|nr:Zinc-finger homeodomain protein 2 [Vitis vinifera]
MKGMELSVVPYGRSAKMEVDDVEEDEAAENKPMVMNPKATAVKPRYRECMRNHAASIGGHASDGCGEFMPSGGGGGGDAASLTCAACGCHRNFHRREPEECFRACASHKFLGVPAFGGVDHHHHHHQDDGERQYDRRSETPERGDVQMATMMTTTKNKRFRTKFTQEQKERMLELAERLGWRIQKQDDVVLSQFCSELGIKRNVLKVWMHNNKNAHRRREPPPESPPPPPPPPPPSMAPPQAAGV